MNYKLEAASVFADGKSVGAYEHGQVPDVTDAPNGAAKSTKTMSGGSCTFEGLDATKVYYAGCNLGTEEAPRWQYVMFTPGNPGESNVPDTATNETVTGKWTFTDDLTVEDLVAAGAGTFAGTLTASAKMAVVGELEVDGELNHDGTKVGFLGAAPVAKAAALTAAKNETIDVVYGAPEEATLKNVQTRVNELETALKAYGLLS